MERVVYILGAGFSAPAGIPTIRNFLKVANDLHGEDGKAFAHFNHVFKRLDELGHVGTFYAADLKNIEDVLSMLEMRAFASNNPRDEADLKIFEKFICSVIRATTPEVKENFKESFFNMAFRNNNREMLNLYASFVLGLFNIDLVLSENDIEIYNNRLSQQAPPFRTIKRRATAHYDVISLNYDNLLENSLKAINQQIQQSNECDFTLESDLSKVLLAKLHGDANTGVVVCPTWNKAAISDTNKATIKDAWRAAYSTLTRATQIRILGYSLPDLDAYIRYLLKSAIHNSRDLTRIDIICLDPDKTVEKRYKTLIPNYSGFEFISANVEDYLNNCRPLQQSTGRPWSPNLEYAHAYRHR